MMIDIDSAEYIEYSGNKVRIGESGRSTTSSVAMYIVLGGSVEEGKNGLTQIVTCGLCVA